MLSRAAPGTPQPTLFCGSATGMIYRKPLTMHGLINVGFAREKESNPRLFFLPLNSSFLLPGGSAAGSSTSSALSTVEWAPQTPSLKP
jgi:hypothetical protein